MFFWIWGKIAFDLCIRFFPISLFSFCSNDYHFWNGTYLSNRLPGFHAIWKNEARYCSKGVTWLPRKLGSMVGKWVITPRSPFVSRWNNTLILPFTWKSWNLKPLKTSNPVANKNGTFLCFPGTLAFWAILVQKFRSGVVSVGKPWPVWLESLVSSEKPSFPL